MSSRSMPAKHEGLPLVADARIGLERISAGLGNSQGRHRLDRQGQGRQGRVAEGRRQGDGNHQCGAAFRRPGHRCRPACTRRSRRRSSSARQAGCPASCTSSGRRKRPAATTWNTASRPWAMKSPAASAPSSPSPDSDVIVMVGDGSYMMLNSEIASSIMLGAKITIVLLDNAGYGCINRLQMATGGANFNNLLQRHAPCRAAGDRFRCARRGDGRRSPARSARFPNWNRR